MSMPTYKYQAALPTGVWIFGVFDAADETALQAYLQTRGMTLVEATELSINTALTGQMEELPRMLQLRIGERLREAMLTDMPVHEAVRAIADEPFEHPVLMMMPWIFSLAAFAAAAAGLLAVIVPEARSVLLLTAVVLVASAGVMWWVSWLWFIARPGTVLRTLAGRLERGSTEPFANVGLLPGELRAVINSNMDSRAKIVSVAELVPTISGMQMQAHQLAARLMGPLLAMSVLLIGLHVVLLTVVVSFKEIFIGFGVNLPVVSVMVLTFSDWARAFGIPGLGLTIVGLTGMLATVYGLLVWPRTAEVFESIPGIGLSVRWLMQARVARILGVLIRNQTPPADAIAVASKASGFQSVAKDGEQIAAIVRSGSTDLGYSRRLSGLPLSMLFRLSDGQDSERTRQETAQSFQTYAASLEQASAGNGSFLAVLFEMLVITIGGILVGIFIIAMFLPLIKLLNDLAVVVWSVR